jgi:multidrug efflux pump subunit AcrA (membrane-fusion protein)
MTVRFTVSGYADRSFEGRVSSVSPAADPATGQINVIVSIPNSGQTLVAGLFAEGRIAAQSRTALLAPVAAVDLAAATTEVMRVRNGRVESAAVSVGTIDAATETIEILSGVAANDTLLIGGARSLPVGTQVRMSGGASNDAPKAPGASSQGGGQ